MLFRSYKRVPSKQKLKDSFNKFVAQKDALDTQLARAAKSINGLRLGMRNAANRLNDVFVRVQNIPELRFGEDLQKLRQDLMTAEELRAETETRLEPRQKQVTAMQTAERPLIEPLRTLRQQVAGELGEAKVRAATRQGPEAARAVEQAERAAQDAAARQEEQARLERAEAFPAQRIEFTRQLSENRDLKALIEKAQFAQTTEERTVARKELDEYLQKFIARKNDELKEMQRLAAQNIENKEKQRKLRLE